MGRSASTMASLANDFRASRINPSAEMNSVYIMSAPNRLQM